MKRQTIAILACIGTLFLASSCSEGNFSPESIIPLTFTSPDGFTRVIQQHTKGDDQEESPEILSFTQASFYEDSDRPGCMLFMASTNGRMSYDFFWLSLSIDQPSLSVGSPAKIEELRFCLPFSSDSRNYTDWAEGSIFVKQVTNDTIVLRFDKVVFSILQGTYTMSGDLIYTRSTPVVL